MLIPILKKKKTKSIEDYIAHIEYSNEIYDVELLYQILKKQDKKGQRLTIVLLVNPSKFRITKC